MRSLSQDEIDSIALGASVLGAGGGGNPEIGKLLVKACMDIYGKVNLIEVEELKSSDFVVCIGEMGAPLVSIEKIGRLEDFPKAVKLLCAKLGNEATAILPVEVGGLNSILPMIAAMQLNLPVIDADLMGRAFPETQMTSFSLNGIVASPMVVLDERDNSCLIETSDTIWAERLARTLTSSMGGRSVVATFGVSGDIAKSYSVAGTITLSQRIGELIRYHKADSFQALLQALRGRVLFKGRISDVKRQIISGFNKGSVTLVGKDEFDGSSCKIEFRNENLICFINGKVVATVPDIISILNEATLHPITTEELRYGYRCIVVGFPAAPIWRTKKGIATAGPRYFGYELDYVPIESAQYHV